MGLIQGQGKILRNERIGSVTSSLKTLAKELKITIVVLSQLNRESAKKYDAPQLESLRDSGNIEQDADIVIMPHRDRDKDPEDDNYDLTKMEVFIRKNRNGKLGIIRMNTEMQYMSITEDTTTMAKKSIPRKTKDDENDLPF